MDAFIVDYSAPPSAASAARSPRSAPTISARCRSARSSRAIRRVDWAAVDDVIYRLRQPGGRGQPQCRAHGRCCSPACPMDVPGTTINRLCGSGMDAVIASPRAPIKAGEAELMIAGGVEIDEPRAFRACPRPTARFRASAEIYDTTIGWRFVNPLMKNAVRRRFDAGDRRERRRGISSVARRPGRLRRAQPGSAPSPRRPAAGWPREIVAGRPSRSARATRSIVDKDEHPRADTTLEALAKLPTPFREGGTVTAGNASGVNDGAAALIIASEAAVASATG